LVVSWLPVSLQGKTRADDAAAHVVVDAAEGVGFDVEAGLFADLAA
jgi:hypothetical protein